MLCCASTAATPGILQRGGSRHATYCSSAIPVIPKPHWKADARAHESVCRVPRSRTGHRAERQDRSGEVRLNLREQGSLHQRSGFWKAEH